MKYFWMLCLSVLCTARIAALSIDQVQINPTAPTSDDEVFLELSGYFANGCGYIISENVTLIGNTLFVQISAAYTPGICTQALVPWSGSYALGKLPAGTYSISFSQSQGVNVNGTVLSEFIVTQGAPIQLVLAPLPQQNISAGSSFQCPVQLIGAFLSTSVFQVQLSDLNGNFQNPQVLGSCVGQNCNTILSTIPVNLSAGNYLVRVVCLNPFLVSNQVTLQVQNCPNIPHIFTGITETSANVVWADTVVDPSENITLRYRASGVGANWTITAINPNGNLFTFTPITGLDTCTKYEFQSQRKCQSGQLSPWSVLSYFTTDGCSPTQCTPPSQISFNSSNGLLFWTPSPEMACDGIYTISYRKIGEPIWSQAQSLIGDCSMANLPDNNINLQTWLQPCTEYEFLLEGACTGTISEFAIISNTFTTAGCGTLAPCHPNPDSLLCQDWLQDTLLSFGSCQISTPFKVRTADYSGGKLIVIERDSLQFSTFYDFYQCDGRRVQSMSLNVILGNYFSPDPPLFTLQDVILNPTIWICTDPYPVCQPCNSTTSTIDTTLCPNDSITIGAQTFTASGQYMVTIPNAAGCDSIIFLTLTIGSYSPQFSGNAIICPGQTTTTIEISNPPANAQFIWRDANGNTVGSGSVFSSATLGTYTISSTLSGGCTYQDTVTVQNAPQITVLLSAPDSVCAGGQAQLGVLNPSISWLWSTGDTTPNPLISNLQNTTTFTVTITQTNGCTAVGTKTVQVNLNPSVDILGATQVCQGNQIELVALPNIASNTYAWSAPGAVGNMLSDSPQNATTYSVTATDQNGCTATDAITVNIGNLSVSLGGDTSICKSPQVKLSPNLLSPDSVKWYSINNPNSVISTMDTLTVTMSGLYIVHVFKGVCDAKDTIEVTGNTLEIGSFLIMESTCFSPTGSILLTPINGRSPYAASWQGGQNGLQVNNLPSGTYAVTVTDLNGCTHVSEHIVSNSSPMQSELAMINGPDIITSCFDTISLSAAKPFGANGLWTSDVNSISFQSITQNGTLVKDLVPGVNFLYWVLSTSQCPAYSIDSVKVLFEQNIPLLEADTAKQVVGASIEIPYLNNDILAPNSTGYTHELLAVDTKIDGTELWTDTTFFFMPNDLRADTVHGIYRICNKLCNQQCDTTDLLAIYYKIPVGDTQDHVISPNGDRKNDGLAFDFLNNTLFPNNQLYVYNRWGTLVYRAAPYENGSWLGRANNGEILPAGTYYFVLRLEQDNSTTIYGDVLILR